jgi:hypothetical protein
MPSAQGEHAPPASHSAPGHWLRRIGSVAAGAIAAAIAVHSSVGFAISPLNPVLAGTVAPGHAATLSNLTQFSFLTARSRDQLPEVERLARNTITVAPLDHAAARTVAALDVIGQRHARSQQLFTLVGANTLRDAITHAWLLNYAYRERKFDMVVREADIALRLDAKLQPAAFAALNQLVADGRVIPALARTLEGSPPWRTAYLLAMGQQRGARDNQLRLLRALRRGSTPPTAEELRTFLLVDSTRVDAGQLARVYAELSPVRFGQDETRIRNGNFEGNRNHGPFGWVYYSGDLGFAEVTASPDGRGKAMYAEFEGRQNATVATQYLTLAPGAYTLNLRSYGLSELTGQTRLQLSCQTSPTSRRLQATMPIRGGIGSWQAQRWRFNVPRGCAGPIIDLAWQPQTVSSPEQLYIDDIVIRPATAGRGAQASPSAQPTTGARD